MTLAEAPSKAHQRIIADREREQNPREGLTSLDGYFVEPSHGSRPNP